MHVFLARIFSPPSKACGSVLGTILRPFVAPCGPLERDRRCLENVLVHFLLSYELATEKIIIHNAEQSMAWRQPYVNLLVINGRLILAWAPRFETRSGLFLSSRLALVLLCRKVCMC